MHRFFFRTQSAIPHNQSWSAVTQSALQAITLKRVHSNE